MNTDALCSRPLSEVAELIRGRDVSAADVTEAVLARIDRVGPTLNCYISVLHEQARAQARRLDEALQAGRYLGPLHGIPISLKDNINTAGIETTAGSPILAGSVPTTNATVVDRVQAAGAVVIAKANLYEFAYGAPHPRFGPVRNPWKLDRSCGGSSSGSASAVAGGLCYGSIGTDTGGSIRGPASLCGIVGVRPTYGLVSRAGVIPVSYSLDAAGPMTRTVRDAALLLQAMAGHDPRDPASATRATPDFTARLGLGLRGLQLGIPLPAALEELDAEVRAAIRQAYTVFEREGAELVEVNLPDYRIATTVMWAIASVEAAEYHRGYLRTRAEDYHPKVRTLLELGEFIPATEYVHVQRVRQALIAQFRAVFKTVDAVLVPAFPGVAYRIGAESVRLNGRDVPLKGLAHYTTLFSVTGRPALVMPCGFSAEGLPIGLQIGARAFDEATLFQVADAYERATEWHRKQPAVAAA